MYLNCHSYYSLRYGTLSPKELVAEAKLRGIKKLVLTDINLVSGIYDFVQECTKVGIEPVVGVEFRNGDEFRYICIAKNNAGFAEINAFLSKYLLAEKEFPVQAPAFDNVLVIYAMSIYESYAPRLPNEYIGLRHWEQKEYFKYRKKIEQSRLIAWQPVSFLNKQKYNVHRLLRAISHNCLLSKLPTSAHASIHENFPYPQEMETYFKAHAPALELADSLLQQCSFSVEFNTPKNKKTFTGSKEADLELLKKLTAEGQLYRYGKPSKTIQERIDKELAIIDELNFSSYFLITWDIIKYAQSRGYHHVGRGSGANSIVAYCMGITDVDPIELDLYFERFINPFRSSPPDFDIDFSWDERDEIIDYVFKRYGKEHVCLMATYNTFKGRSIYRELAKVFGLPKAEIDALIQDPTADHQNEHTHYIFKYAPLMIDFPEKLSIHAGGILISEEPLHCYSALQPMPKGFPICQFDMYVAEDIGFAKFDVLSQRGLGHIKSAVDIIKRNCSVDIDIHAIQKFKEDPLIRKQLMEHETMGTFYAESPAMRQLIWKLKCNNYLTLVAASSIIRPGVSSSGMMQEYIKRHHKPYDIDYIHPRMEELLQETYGVMVYQEDVIKVAHHFAGFTLAESDVLRRAMSGKYRSRLEFKHIVDKWFKNCKERGYPDAIAKEVWRQIESFSGYSFSKAHSASFAVESYQSFYLKAHYPIEFMVAVINNFGGFYNSEMYLHEARRYGAILEAPDINKSEYLCHVEDKTIWLGWVHVQGLENRSVRQIEMQEQPFVDFSDFLTRVNIGLEQIVILIRVGAFRSFGHSKKELLWEAHFYCNKTVRNYATDPVLFKPEVKHFELPVLISTAEEDYYDELELLGFSLQSPFGMIAEVPRSKLTAADLLGLVDKQISIYGYLVTYKGISTVNNKRMAFGYFIDHEGQYFDTTHFPQSLERFPFRGKGMYFMRGKVVEDYGFPSIEVNFMEKVELKPDPRSVPQYTKQVS